MKTLLLEPGVGFNTPGITLFPFEQLTFREENVRLLRFNRDDPTGPRENETKTIALSEDMTALLQALSENTAEN